jgi:phosphate:Na+ symporter
VWLIAGDEDGGVAQTVRGLAGAVRHLGVEPVIISLRDAAFSESMRAMGFDVRTLNVKPLPVLRGGLVRKIRQQLQVRRAIVATRPKLADVLRSANVSAVHVLAGLSFVHQSLGSLDKAPIVAGLLAFLATAVIQNSATVIALAITFQIHHLASLGVGLEMVLGANLGSTAASVYSALLGGSQASKRAAFAYFLMKLAGAVVFTLGLSSYARVIVAIDPGSARTLADAHSLFNLVIAAAFLPLAPFVARVMNRVLPDPIPVPVTRLDPNLFSDPESALPLTQAEIGRMAELIGRRLIHPLAPLLFGPSDDRERMLREAEMEIDLMHDAISQYLIGMGGTRRLSERHRARQIELFYLANLLEHLSDTVIKVVDTRVKLSSRDFHWTENLTARMNNLTTMMEQYYAKMAEAISKEDLPAVRELVQANPELRRLEGEVRLYILTHGGEFERHALAAVLELSDDLAVLTSRMGDVGRAALGMV